MPGRTKLDKDGRRLMPGPNPYAKLDTFGLAHAAGDMSSELREMKLRTPEERRDLADRCIYLLIACNQRLLDIPPVR